MRYVAAVALTFLLVPLVAMAQKTSFVFDKTANFAGYKTYALKEGTKVGDPLIDNRIVTAIDSEFAAKGLTQSDTPDVAVVYHIAFDTQKNLTAWSTGVGPYSWRWGGGFSTTNVRVNEIVVGTLVIDVADVKKNEVVWRGIGVKEIDTNAKADKRERNIREAVQKILRNYPPKK